MVDAPGQDQGSEDAPRAVAAAESHEGAPRRDGEDRRRFRSTNDWYNLVNEVKAGEEIDLRALRTACYREIEEVRGRPLLVYAVHFPNAPAKANTSVDLDDIDGFVDLIGGVSDEHRAVDVLLHSPGGRPDATERIVELLRFRFDEIAFLVPHSAYSAATMLALSGDEIILHPAASLGPIDPQINGVPTRSIRRGFERVRDLLKDEGPEALPAYIPLIEKHSLETLEICEDAEELSKELVTEWLSSYMFRDRAGDPETTELVENIVGFFASYDEHKTHARPLTYRKLKDLGIELTLADEPLRGLLREAHIVLNGFLSGTPFVKIYEDAYDLSWGRQFQVGGRPNEKSEDG